MWAAKAARTSGLAAASAKSGCSNRSRFNLPVSVKYFWTRPRSRHAESVRGKSVVAASDPNSQPLTASESFSSALNFGSFWFCRKAAMRGSISGFNPGSHLLYSGGQRRAVGPLLDLRHQGLASRVNRLPLRLELLVGLLHLADGLQDFARHVFRGEFLEDFLHQGVLPALLPQPQLIEHLLGVHEPQLFQRGLKLLGDLRVVLEILEDLLATPPPPCCSACTEDKNVRSSCGVRGSWG